MSKRRHVGLRGDDRRTQATEDEQQSKVESVREQAGAVKEKVPLPVLGSVAGLAAALVLFGAVKAVTSRGGQKQGGGQQGGAEQGEE